MKVYILHMAHSNYYKIGCTSRPIEERLQNLQPMCPGKLEIVAEFPDADEYFENLLHNRFKSYRLANGEWFSLEEDFIDSLKSEFFVDGKFVSPKTPKGVTDSIRVNKINSQVVKAVGDGAIFEITSLDYRSVYLVRKPKDDSDAEILLQALKEIGKSKT